MNHCIRNKGLHLNEERIASTLFSLFSVTAIIELHSIKCIKFFCFWLMFIGWNKKRTKIFIWNWKEKKLINCFQMLVDMCFFCIQRFPLFDEKPIIFRMKNSAHCLTFLRDNCVLKCFHVWKKKRKKNFVILML